MKILKLPSGKSKGQAMLEFAIVLPILLLVVYGLIETGRLLFIYSSVNNATRQAARFGSTSGISPTSGVPRYQDCDGIRLAAQRGDFLNAFDDDDIEIYIDNGLDNSGAPIGQTLVCTGGVAVDTGITPKTGDRITVNVDAAFNALLPNLVPFISQTINAESSRTLLLTISIQPPKENTVTLITADNPDASEVGQPVTVSVSVTADTTPTGTVNITGADSNCTITLSNGSGSCVVIFTSLGSKTLNAFYVGDDTHNPSSDTESHTVIPTSTELTITADTPDPSLIGATVTVEVEVKNANTWGSLPTGTVTISGADGTVPTCTVNLNNGSGNCNLNFGTDGTKTLTATYNPTSTHSTSSDTEEHVVISPAETITTILSDSPDPSGIGQSVTVNVAVTGSTTPTGTVAITGADTNCTITLSGGTGSCPVVFNSIGNKTLTATYTPATTAHNPSSDTESHAVQLFPTITTITADTPDPSDIGQTVNVTVTVTGGTTPPTGTVAITGADTNCNITLSGGTGTCPVNFSFGGTRTLTATYSGSSTHSPSNDTETHVVVQQPVVGCNNTNVTVGLLQRTADGAMMMNINNSLSAQLLISNVSVKWNNDKGNWNGPDQTIRLQSARLGNIFWTGNEVGPTYTITPASTFIPPGTSTIVFAFHQIFDRWDNTESITINLSTPGCEGVVLFQNQNSGN
jgi:hypothetical protein